MNPQAQQNPQSIGESAIPPQVQQQVAPDVTNQQGQSQLFQKAVMANSIKPVFDILIKKIADKLGADNSSRVKQIETMGAKIAQKRLAGRQYGIENLNDILGSRIIIASKSDLPEAKTAIQQLAKTGFIDINKSEDASHQTYGAWHVDGKVANGTPFEIQIMTKKQEGESLINHGLRAVHGEDVKGAVEQLKNKQADIINKLPDKKVSAISEAMKNIMKQTNNQPVDPRITSQLLAQTSK